jgi:MFS family permease
VESDGSRAPRAPWWIPPVFGRTPDLEPRHLRLLGLVSLALLFENYDFSLLTAALPFIAESLALEEAELGNFTALIRLGALPAFLVIPVADRLGRRRVFLVSIFILSLGTVLTGFAQTANQFLVIQIVTRTFMLTSSAVAFVMISEELPAAHRGWGIGILGALASMGHGLSALLFAAVDYLPFGWRALYVVGLAPVFFLPQFRRGIEETRRFAQASPVAATGGVAGYLEPIRLLIRRFPGRALGLAALGLLTAAATSSVYQFTAQFLLTRRGWAPGQYSLLLLTGGAIGIMGNVLAGRLSDAFGRRRVGVAFLIGFPVLAWGFLNGVGPFLVVSWTLMTLSLTGSATVSRAFATELFPTAFRGTATGGLTLMETLGAALGLVLVSAGMSFGTDLVTMLVALSFLAPIGAATILTFPETGGRELEAISE